MTTITITRDNNRRIGRFTVEGHAEYGEAGKDIVCASVSAITGTAIVGLEQFLGIKPTVNVDSKRGYLDCGITGRLTDRQVEDANVILETMILGLKDISKKYKKYLRVLDKEV